MTLRLAEHADIEAVEQDLLRPFHAENGQAPINDAKLRAWVARMVEGGHVLVVERDGKLAGGLGMREVPYAYADASFLADEFYYVRREWRGESVGLELERAFRDIAASAGQKGVLTVFNPKRAGKRGRYASLFGFVPFGYNVRVV